jgi:hypothetical protein
MAKRPEKFRTFAEEQTANSLWLVCPDAAIPVGSVDLGRKIAESMPCEHDHAVITLDLRPRGLAPHRDGQPCHRPRRDAARPPAGLGRRLTEPGRPPPGGPTPGQSNCLGGLPSSRIDPGGRAQTT